jgi:outer membrane murein-binding lipoprotein Lpp
MMKLHLLAGAVVLAAVLAAGCAAQRALTPLPASGPDMVTQDVAALFIRAVNDTRASNREVAGWCWSDARTGRLWRVVRAGYGDDAGVGLALPLGRRGDHELSCSWHTHLWGRRVVPGPSRRDLLNSSLPQLRDIHHFVVDRHGIWHYADGRVLSMCPWNGAGTNFDAAACRS